MAANHLLELSGVQLSFPYKPYASQLSFMTRMITALKQKDNALLEAPTGSGKTLCLLSGALAWQQQKKTQLEAEHQAATAAAAAAHAAQELGQEEAGSPALLFEPPKKPKCPTIFFASRTHSQLTQVVRELKKTQYKPSMAILASRKNYCVNKSVLKSGNVDEGCDMLIKEGYGCPNHKKEKGRLGGGLRATVHDIEELKSSCKAKKQCPYFTARELTQTADLVFAPYSYLLDPCVRAAMDVDSALNEAVLIFDEAHNIEDQCREAASCELELAVIQEVLVALQAATNMSDKKEIYEPLMQATEKVCLWLEGTAQSPQMAQRGTYGQVERWFNPGGPMEEQLSAAGLSPDEVAELWKLYRKAKQNESKAQFSTEGDQAGAAVPADQDTPGAGGMALGVISRLLTSLRLMYGQIGSKEDSREAYRMIIKRWGRKATDRQQAVRGRKRQQQDDAQAQAREAVSLCLWCFDPSVAFRDAMGRAHSIILASGTLSPLDSFASELGTHFKISLEAPHVVDIGRQVWSGVMQQGPTGGLVSGTFSQTESLAYQDEVGTGVLELAQVVPNGMLVFFASYGMMDKLASRWKATQLWDELGKHKDVVVETREAGKPFEDAMARFQAAVRGERGAILLAVCRGKASEGIDFADEQARAVVLVGIPYPAAKDTQVVMKKQYNDAASRPRGMQRHVQAEQHAGPADAQQQGSPPSLGGTRTVRQLLSGDKWYTQTAFRALNQAVGRCIRHRYDFGALIFFDSRFKDTNKQVNLSKWVRGNVRNFGTWSEGMTSLKAFYKTLALSPPKRPEAPTPDSAAAASDGQEAAAGPSDVQRGPVKIGYEDEAVAPGQSGQQPKGQTLQAFWKPQQGSKHEGSGKGNGTSGEPIKVEPTIPDWKRQGKPMHGMVRPSHTGGGDMAWMAGSGGCGSAGVVGGPAGPTGTPDPWNQAGWGQPQAPQHTPLGHGAASATMDIRQVAGMQSRDQGPAGTWGAQQLYGCTAPSADGHGMGMVPSHRSPAKAAQVAVVAAVAAGSPHRRHSAVLTTEQPTQAYGPAGMQHQQVHMQSVPTLYQGGWPGGPQIGPHAAPGSHGQPLTQTQQMPSHAHNQLPQGFQTAAAAAAASAQQPPAARGSGWSQSGTGATGLHAYPGARQPFAPVDSNTTVHAHPTLVQHDPDKGKGSAHQQQHGPSPSQAHQWQMPVQPQAWARPSTPPPPQWASQQQQVPKQQQKQANHQLWVGHADGPPKRCTPQSNWSTQSQQPPPSVNPPHHQQQRQTLPQQAEHQQRTWHQNPPQQQQQQPWESSGGFLLSQQPTQAGHGPSQHPQQPPQAWQQSTPYQPNATQAAVPGPYPVQQGWDQGHQWSQQPAASVRGPGPTQPWAGQQRPLQPQPLQQPQQQQEQQQHTHKPAAMHLQQHNPAYSHQLQTQQLQYHPPQQAQQPHVAAWASAGTPVRMQGVATPSHTPGSGCGAVLGAAGTAPVTARVTPPSSGGFQPSWLQQQGNQAPNFNRPPEAILAFSKPVVPHAQTPPMHSPAPAAGSMQVPNPGGIRSTTPAGGLPASLLASGSSVQEQHGGWAPGQARCAVAPPAGGSSMQGTLAGSTPTPAAGSGHKRSPDVTPGPEPNGWAKRQSVGHDRPQ